MKQKQTETFLQALDKTAFSFPIERPSSRLLTATREEYNTLLHNAYMKEQEGEYEATVRLYCSALALCDEDVALHGKLAWLLNKLTEEI